MRREDGRFLTGAASYTADRLQPGTLHAVFLRSDRPHAEIAALDAARAAGAPGVRLVLTGADLQREALADFPVAAPSGRVVKSLRVPPRPALADGRVCYVGESVALVVAEAREAAADAVEAIVVDYRDLPAVTDVAAALASGAPPVHPGRDELRDNVCFAMEHGAAAAANAAFARAAHAVRLELRANRVVGNPLEPRAAIAAFDASTGRYRLTLGHQGADSMREQLAAVLRIDARRLEIETPDVGGAFGVKEPAYPEYAALLVAARRLARPVAWISSRSEAFLSEHHGRDVLQSAELALDAQGRFLALRFRFACNMGAHIAKAGAYIAAFNPGRSMAGVYDVGAIHGVVSCVLTHTPPVGPYRGAGRPEMAFAIERLVDAAAERTGIDRVALRRMNLIRRFPHTTPHGVTYDSGDFARVLDEALAAAQWDSFPGRCEAATRLGRARGIGLSCFLEATGGPTEEGVALRFAGDGSVAVLVRTQSSGQGHETVFPELAAKLLGIPPASVRLVQGLHDALPTARAASLAGGSTIASRSLTAFGGAIRAAADLAVAAAKRLAARRFEVAERDVELSGGVLRVAGTDRSVEFLAFAAELAPADNAARHPLDAEANVAAVRTFPNGCHVAEVEIDPETGAVSLVAYTMVNDFGVVQSPSIAEGQAHGGAAQGAGQALMEHCRFAPDSGQLLSGSLMDYALPRASDLPLFRLHFAPSPSPAHALGSKGAGESGATGAPAAIANAVADALRALGCELPDMPFTPERLWCALQGPRRPSFSKTGAKTQASTRGRRSRPAS
jgi:carbon-monoxide dehydrogenase large subunit